MLGTAVLLEVAVPATRGTFSCVAGVPEQVVLGYNLKSTVPWGIVELVVEASVTFSRTIVPICAEVVVAPFTSMIVEVMTGSVSARTNNAEKMNTAAGMNKASVAIGNALNVNVFDFISREFG